MQTRLRLAREALVPSRRVIVLMVAAVGLLLVGSACALAFELSGAGEDETVGVRALGAAMFYMPLVAIVLFFASLVAKHPAPRAMIWFIISSVVVVAGLMLALAMALDPDAGAVMGGSTFVLFCAPVALVVFLPAVYFGLKARPDIAAAMRDARQKRIADALSRRGGIVRVRDLASDLAFSDDEAAALVDDMLRSERLAGVFFRGHGLLYERTTLAGQQRRLIGMVHVRGQVRVDDLAGELGIPLGLLKEWLYDLVRRGRFSGYINWNDGLLYSAEAQALRDTAVCPRCSGSLSLAGKGVIECEYCGAEIFL